MRQPKRSDDKYWTGTRIFHEEQFISDLQDHIDLLNQRIEALSIADVSDLCCASCGYQMKFDKGEDKWGCTKCGHTSQHYR